MILRVDDARLNNTNDELGERDTSARTPEAADDSIVGELADWS